MNIFLLVYRYARIYVIFVISVRIADAASRICKTVIPDRSCWSGMSLFFHFIFYCFRFLFFFFFCCGGTTIGVSSLLLCHSTWSLAFLLWTEQLVKRRSTYCLEINIYFSRCFLDTRSFHQNLILHQFDCLRFTCERRKTNDRWIVRGTSLTLDRVDAQISGHARYATSNDASIDAFWHNRTPASVVASWRFIALAIPTIAQAATQLAATASHCCRNTERSRGIARECQQTRRDSLHIERRGREKSWRVAGGWSSRGHQIRL